MATGLRRIKEACSGQIGSGISRADAVEDGDAEQTIIIHNLLDHLVAKHPRKVKVAKMRLFLQLTFVEIAEVMNLSADTAESDWCFPRTWLKREWGQTSTDHNQ